MRTDPVSFIMMNPHIKTKLVRCYQIPVAIGIDVGTGSARCGVFSLDGKLMGTASVDITMTQPGDGKQGEFAEFFQQSSSNIWESICKVKQLK